MAVEVIMPQLGESVVEGTVTKWLKQVDEAVSEFEPLVEINTDKVDTEVPSPASGTVLARYVNEGETVQAGTVLAVIGEPGEEVPARGDGGARKAVAPAGPPGAPQPSAAEAPATVKIAPAVEPSPARKREDLGFISPVVAKMAAEHGIDLTQVPGTGHGGRITKKDLQAYLAQRPAAAPWEEPGLGELFRPTEELAGRQAAPAQAPAAAGDVLPLDPVRRSIAEHMVRSRHTSAHVTTVMEVDLSRVIAHRLAHKEAFRRDGVNLTFTAYFAAAAVAAIKQVPLANASWSDRGIVLHRQVNIGIAVSLGDKGLIVPVVRNADQLSLLALARAINDLADRARARKLQPDEVQGGTFTITNHGVSGSLFATPIINQPQSAILGVGAVQKRVVVLEGKGPAGEPVDSIGIRPMVYLTLTLDHRMLDGAIGDQFLGTVVQRLQQWN